MAILFGGRFWLQLALAIVSSPSLLDMKGRCKRVPVAVAQLTSYCFSLSLSLSLSIFSIHCSPHPEGAAVITTKVVASISGPYDNLLSRRLSRKRLSRKGLSTKGLSTKGLSRKGLSRKGLSRKGHIEGRNTLESMIPYARACPLTKSDHPHLTPPNLPVSVLVRASSLGKCRDKWSPRIWGLSKSSLPQEIAEKSTVVTVVGF